MAALDSAIFAVTGLVQAEILVLSLVGGAITLTGVRRGTVVCRARA